MTDSIENKEQEQKPAGSETQKKEENGSSPGEGKVKVKAFALIVLALVLILFTVQNAVYIKTNHSPPYADSVHHLTLARHYYWSIFDSSAPRGRPDLFQKYPFVTYFTTAVFFRIFGNTTQTALWSLYPFAIIFLISIFGIGYYFGKDWGAAASVAVAGSTQLLMQMSHVYLLDLPQTAMTAFSFYCLLRTERFTRKKESIIFGVVFALALLTKWSAAFWMTGPLLIYFILLLMRKSKTVLLPISVFLIEAVVFGLILKSAVGFYFGRSMKMPVAAYLVIHLLIGCALLAIVIMLPRLKEKWFQGKDADNLKTMVNASAAFLISVLLSGIWYTWNIIGVISKLGLQKQEMQNPAPYEGQNLFKISIDYYLRSQEQFFTAFFVLTVIGIIFIFIRREKMAEKLSLVSMIGGLVIIAPLAPPAIFYTLSALIPLSVLAGYWLSYAWYFRFPLFAGILAYTLISLLFPFIESNRFMFYLRFKHPGFSYALLNENIPNDNDYKLKEVVYDSLKFSEKLTPREKNDRGKAGFFAYSTDNFRRKAGISEINSHTVGCIADDLNVQALEFVPVPNEWIRVLEENRKMVLLSLFCYIRDDFPEEIIETIFKKSGRKAEILKKYTLWEDRKMVLIRIEPKGVSR